MIISANYKAVPLSGAMSTFELGDGVTGTSIHRVYCLAPGTVTITPAGGGTFTYVAASANDYIDVLVKELTVVSGTFIGFKARYFEHQHGPFN